MAWQTGKDEGKLRKVVNRKKELMLPFGAEEANNLLRDHDYCL